MKINKTNIYLYIYNRYRSYRYIKYSHAHSPPLCNIYDPGIRFRAPPEWVGSTQEKGKKQYVSLCGSLTTRITCIHTYTQTIHTHIHTYRLIHTYTHTCMYIQTRPSNPQGGGGGKTTCNRPAPPVHIDPCAPRPFGGGVGWGLQTWTIYAQSVILGAQSRSGGASHKDG